jgi:OFA family oxalate/formate antiporter-like MFS transporter
MKVLSIRVAISSIILSLCIGQVYAWSLLSSQVNLLLAHDMSFAFSLAILFLGLSAAFMGKYVEKHPKETYILSSILFVLGFIGSAIALKYRSVMWFYLTYGVIFGCSCGLGYVAPIKTLMLYFRHNKAIASAIAILSFGLAKAICSPVYAYLTSNYKIDKVFIILAIIYGIPLFIAGLFFKKFPVDFIPKNSIKFNIKSICNVNYIAIWLFFFSNIALGLALISQEAQLYKHFDLSLSLITLFCALSATFNALGRFGYAWISDHTNRYMPYIILFVLSSIMCFSDISIASVGMFVTSIMIINLNYGGGFSSLPSLLADKYGINNTSTIHSLTLSAWGIAGLASLYLKRLDLTTLLIVCGIIYLFNLILLYLAHK